MHSLCIERFTDAVSFGSYCYDQVAHEITKCPFGVDGISVEQFVFSFRFINIRLV